MRNGKRYTTTKKHDGKITLSRSDRINLIGVMLTGIGVIVSVIALVL